MRNQNFRTSGDPRASAQPLRRVVISLALLGLALALLALVLFASANPPWPMILFLAALILELGILSHRIYGKAIQPGVSFQADEDSIARSDLEGRVTRVHWGEVARVRYVISGCTTLEFFRVAEDSASIQFPLSAENVDELLTVLLRRTPQVVREVPFVARVSRGRRWRGLGSLIFMFFPFLVVAVYWLLIGDWRTSLWALLIPGSFLSLLLVLFTLLPIREIRVDHQDLIVSSTIRKSRWSFSEIDAIALQVNQAGSFRSLDFRLKLRSGEIRKVPCLDDDPIGCFHALERMIDQSRALVG